MHKLKISVRKSLKRKMGTLNILKRNDLIESAVIKF